MTPRTSYILLQTTGISKPPNDLVPRLSKEVGFESGMLATKMLHAYIRYENV